MNHANARQALLSAMKRLDGLQLNHGATGNASLRDGAGFWITPTGIPAAELHPEDMVWLGFDGTRRGQREPSSEWMLHREILLAYPDQPAVVHAHALAATTLSCLERDLPAVHYMIALAGGNSVRCAPYRTFGSAELAQVAVAALQDRRACLMAHHGLVCTGKTLQSALALAVEVEGLCEIYLKLLSVTDSPPLLSDAQMDEALGKFSTYGQQPGVSKSRLP